MEIHLHLLFYWELISLWDVLAWLVMPFNVVHTKVPITEFACESYVPCFAFFILAPVD